jgi:copper chaperone CopZ
VTALFGGELVNLFDKKDEALHADEQSSPPKAQTFVEKMVEAMRYAFVDMMQDIGRWLVVGLVIAGLITIFVPASFFALFADNSLLSMLIVLLFAMPMYLCATGSIPIAVALMMKGLSPGTALVLLMAGPAVNAASMMVAGKVLGRRTLLLYLASIIGGAMAFGLAVDYLLPREWFTSSIDALHAGAVHGQSWFNGICSVVLALLLVNALVRRFRGSEKECECETGCCEVSERVYYIDGLRCNNCRANAEKAIASLEGVERAEVDLPTGRAVVRGTVSEEQVRTAVEALGFKLRIN